MDRIAQAFGEWVPGDGEWQVVLPAGIEAGDHLVLFGVVYSNAGLAGAGPDGWTKHIEEAEVVGSGFHYAVCWSAVADGTESGTTIGWSGLGYGTLGGVVVVFRGGVLPPEVEVTGTATTIVLRTATTTHTATASYASQASDRRILVWWVGNISGTFTPPAGAGIVDFGENDDTEIDVRVGAVEYINGALGSAGALAATTSVNKTSAIANFAIRAQAMAKPADVYDGQPGAIGLVGFGGDA